MFLIKFQEYFEKMFRVPGPLAESFLIDLITPLILLAATKGYLRSLKSPFSSS